MAVGEHGGNALLRLQLFGEGSQLLHLVSGEVAGEQPVVRAALQLHHVVSGDGDDFLARRQLERRVQLPDRIAQKQAAGHVFRQLRDARGDVVEHRGVSGHQILIAHEKAVGIVPAVLNHGSDKDHRDCQKQRQSQDAVDMLSHRFALRN